MPVDCSTEAKTKEFLTRLPAWNTQTKAAIEAHQAMGSTTQGDRDKMTALQIEINDASVCLGNAIDKLSATSTTSASLQEKLVSLSDELETANNDIEVAKNRVAYIRHPEQQTSNYESWFPIDRPIHVLSLIILMSITIFIGIFILLMILSQFDLDIMLYTPPQTRSTVFTMLYTQMTWSFLAMAIILTSVVIYFVYRK
jgi:hypothetical protein